MKLLHKMKEVNQKKKERKKKKKRHCEVLKKYYCLCLQNWEEQIKKIFMKIIKKSKHELLWKALKQKKAIKKKKTIK